ncbi:MAG: hypothetical protein ACRD22_05445 [Terriglobia bacterium]
MTMYDVCACDWESVHLALARPREPFDWHSKISSAWFPPLINPDVYSRVRKLIDDGVAPGGGISSLEYAAFATKADLLRYLDEWYGPEDAFYGPDSDWPWLRAGLAELRTFIESLDDAGEYALVADEF